MGVYYGESMTALIVIAALVLSWVVANASEAELCAILMAFLIVALISGGYDGV